MPGGVPENRRWVGIQDDRSSIESDAVDMAALRLLRGPGSIVLGRHASFPHCHACLSRALSNIG